MTKQEINKKLKELDRKQFELMMKDIWDWKDYELDRKYTQEMKALQEEFKKAD